jgi:hypothetical protein
VEGLQGNFFLVWFANSKLNFQFLIEQGFSFLIFPIFGKFKFLPDRPSLLHVTGFCQSGLHRWIIQKWPKNMTYFTIFL